MKKAIVNKIIHSSVVDGPGNRAAIFLQGCNYTCKYCHNPETISLCEHCGLCAAQCPVQALTVEEGRVVWKEEMCCGCDTCIQVCPHMASPKVRQMSAQEVMDLLKKDIPFIRGITVSGGECSLQREFLLELFTLAKEKKLSTLMDSNGSYDYMADEELMAVCDGVMLDVKAFDDTAHRELTGMGSEPVLRNAVRLAEAGKLEEIRTVVVPGELPNEETVEKITALLRPFLAEKQIRYKIIAYRPFGVRMPYRKQFQVPGAEEMNRYRKIAEKNGFENVVLI